jgi:hypothetical protein
MIKHFCKFCGKDLSLTSTVEENAGEYYDNFTCDNCSDTQQYVSYLYVPESLALFEVDISTNDCNSPNYGMIFTMNNRDKSTKIIDSFNLECKKTMSGIMNISPDNFNQKMSELNSSN